MGLMNFVVVILYIAFGTVMPEERDIFGSLGGVPC